MQTPCPNCERLNPIQNNSAVETYNFTYRCSCGFQLSITDWMESDAFKAFNEELIKARQNKLIKNCTSCSE